MRLGHLVFDEVLADLNHELRKPHVVEVHVGRLQSVHVRMAGSLIAAPGVFVPVASPACFLGRDAADVVIQQAQHVRKAVDAELAHDAVDRQVGSDLDDPRAGALHLVDHQLLVTVLGQPVGTFAAAIGTRGGLQSARHVFEDFVPAEPHVTVVAAIVEFVLGT